MRWPWVSIHRYDALSTEYQARSSELTHRVSTAERLYTDLLEKYHALKLQGATIPEPVATREPQSIDPVSAAINQAAGNSRQLRSYMAQEAMRLRAAQYSDLQIIEKIQNGVESVEGLPA